MSTPALELRAFAPQRNGRALLVADLPLAGGDAAVVVARAGSGCSSLAAAIAGLLPAAGDVWVGGRRLRGTPSTRRSAGLGAALSDVAVVGGCTVAELVDPALLDALPALARRRDLRAERLSGGERQLLRLALAVAGARVALVVDDPLAGLAEDAAAAARALVERRRADGVAVLWLTTAQDGAPAPATHTVRDGRLVSLSPTG